MNLCVFPTYKYPANVDAKLTPRVSGSVGSQQTFVTPNEGRQKARLLDITEAPGNGCTIAIPLNELCVFSTYKYPANVNAKLTPHVSGSVGGELAIVSRSHTNISCPIERD